MIHVFHKYTKDVVKLLDILADLQPSILRATGLGISMISQASQAINYELKHGIFTWIQC